MIVFLLLCILGFLVAGPMGLIVVVTLGLIYLTWRLLERLVAWLFGPFDRD